jgi:hypothetical protein
VLHLRYSADDHVCAPDDRLGRHEPIISHEDVIRAKSLGHLACSRHKCHVRTCGRVPTIGSRGRKPTTTSRVAMWSGSISSG